MSPSLDKLRTVVKTEDLILLQNQPQKQNLSNYYVYCKTADSTSGRYSRLSEEKKALIRAKARERYYRRKQLGLVKFVSQLSEKEKDARRKYWKDATRRHREKMNKFNQFYRSTNQLQ